MVMTLTPFHVERLVYQLRQREDILKTKYLVQQVITINQQNIEFFIWVFGDTLAEIDSNTRTILTICLKPRFTPKVIGRKEGRVIDSILQL